MDQDDNKGGDSTSVSQSQTNLDKQQRQLERQLASLRRSMSAPSYVDCVPAQVQEQHRAKVDADARTLEHLERTRQVLLSIK